MGTCELESGDVALAAIPIRKMTIGIAQTLLLIIDWRIAMPKRTTGDRPELKPVKGPPPSTSDQGCTWLRLTPLPPTCLCALSAHLRKTCMIWRIGSKPAA